jgi:CheY-like chemotaxis protein
MLILDLNMPDMHGIEVLKFVRNHQMHQRTPVIVLTTRGDEASRGAGPRSRGERLHYQAVHAPGARGACPRSACRPLLAGSSPTAAADEEDTREVLAEGSRSRARASCP